MPVSLVDIKVADFVRPPNDGDGLGLADADTRESLPLKNVSFDIDIAQGFADFQIT